MKRSARHEYSAVVWSALIAIRIHVRWVCLSPSVSIVVAVWLSVCCVPSLLHTTVGCRLYHLSSFFLTFFHVFSLIACLIRRSCLLVAHISVSATLWLCCCFALLGYTNIHTYICVACSEILVAVAVVFFCVCTRTWNGLLNCWMDNFDSQSVYLISRFELFYSVAHTYSSQHIYTFFHCSFVLLPI